MDCFPTRLLCRCGSLIAQCPFVVIVCPVVEVGIQIKLRWHLCQDPTASAAWPSHDFLELWNAVPLWRRWHVLELIGKQFLLRVNLLFCHVVALLEWIEKMVHVSGCEPGEKDQAIRAGNERTWKAPAPDEHRTTRFMHHETDRCMLCMCQQRLDR